MAKQISSIEKSVVKHSLKVDGDLPVQDVPMSGAWRSVTKIHGRTIRTTYHLLFDRQGNVEGVLHDDNGNYAVLGKYTPYFNDSELLIRWVEFPEAIKKLFNITVVHLNDMGEVQHLLQEAKYVTLSKFVAPTPPGGVKAIQALDGKCLQSEGVEGSTSLELQEQLRLPPGAENLGASSLLSMLSLVPSNDGSHAGHINSVFNSSWRSLNDSANPKSKLAPAGLGAMTPMVLSHDEFKAAPQPVLNELQKQVVTYIDEMVNTLTFSSADDGSKVMPQSDVLQSGQWVAAFHQPGGSRPSHSGAAAAQQTWKGQDGSSSTSQPALYKLLFTPLGLVTGVREETDGYGPRGFQGAAEGKRKIFGRFLPEYHGQQGFLRIVEYSAAYPHIDFSRRDNYCKLVGMTELWVTDFMLPLKAAGLCGLRDMQGSFRSSTGGSGQVTLSMRSEYDLTKSLTMSMQTFSDTSIVQQGREAAKRMQQGRVVEEEANGGDEPEKVPNARMEDGLEAPLMSFNSDEIQPQ